jgi:Glycosyl transferase family 2
MIPVTLIFPYFDNPLMLREQIKTINGLSSTVRDALRLIVVDDGSPRHPAADVAVPHDVAVPYRLYRILVNNRWGMDAAKNIAMRHVETKHVLLTDIDHVVPDETWREVMRHEREPRHVFIFPRVDAPNRRPNPKHHPNSWFMHRAIYDEVGGYDERFIMHPGGIYGTDGDFASRLRALPGVQIKWMTNPLIRVPREVIADASTTCYDRKTQADRDGLAKVRAERAKIPNWKPLRYQFPYERVYPTPSELWIR